MRVVGLYISIYVCVCASPSCIVIAQSIARVGQHTARRDRGINQITGVMRWRGRRKKNIYIIYIYSRIITLENETVFFSFFSLAFLCLFFLFFFFFFIGSNKTSYYIYLGWPYGWLFVQQAEHTASGHSTRQREILKRPPADGTRE
jgi:hypothetical protein